MNPARILIAEKQIVLPLVREALSGYELIETTALQQAERLVIENGIDIFVIGIHFDDSRAMELIRVIRMDREHKNSPIVVLRLLPSEIESFLRSTMEVMKSLKAVNEYIEFDGDSEPLDRIKQAVESYLPAQKVATK